MRRQERDARPARRAPSCAKAGASRPRGLAIVVPGRTSSSRSRPGPRSSAGRPGPRCGRRQPLVTRPGRLLLGLDAVRVELLARVALERGVEVGSDAHVDRAERRLTVSGSAPERAAVGEHRHPRHALDAAGDGEPEVAAADPGGGLADCVDAGRAEAVQRDARDGGAPAGEEDRCAGDVGALVVDLGRVAEHHVLDVLRVDPSAFDEGLFELHEEVDGGDVVQRPARGPAPARGADEIVDERVVAVVHASSVRSCRSHETCRSRS